MSILVSHLTYAYGGEAILRDLSLEVAAGRRVGITGVSGGGKSTLLKLLAGLYPPPEGTVRVCGAFAPADIRRHVAMVMQGAALLPVSIRENITCGHPVQEEAVWAACEAAQLTSWVRTLPDGLDSFVGERGGQVSGGQAQRIAIARAIVKDAPVVLLDEATSALDAETGGAVLGALEHLTAGRTVVSVSHRMRALRDMDRVYRLEGGRLHDA